MKAERDERQRRLDTLYWKHGPCCAGCDWWQSANTAAGQCTKSAPVAGKDRYDMLGIERVSSHVGAGHPFTLATHRCGDFKDDFDWLSLPNSYLRLVGAALEAEQ